MLIQYADSAYPTDIPDSNEYLIKSHAQLFKHIKGLLQDHFISTIDLPYTSPNPYSSPTSLPSDNTFLYPSSPQSMFLSSTKATPIKNPTVYPSMVQNSIIVAATAPPPYNLTRYLPFHITYYCIRAATYVSPSVITTTFLPIEHLLTPSLIPCVDTKEVPSSPPSSPSPPDLIHTYNTWLPLMKSLLFWSDMEFHKERVVSKGGENMSSKPPLSQANRTPQ